jgi:hypothetical protein
MATTTKASQNPNTSIDNNQYPSNNRTIVHTMEGMHKLQEAVNGRRSCDTFSEGEDGQCETNASIIQDTQQKQTIVN